MSKDGRSYTDEEVEAIFRRALERQAAGEGGFAHDELIAAAHEVGLDEDAIARTVKELEAERADLDVHATVRRRQRERWVSHLAAYVAIAGSLLALHALGLVAAWAIAFAIVWGSMLALHTFSLARGPSEAALGKERRKRARRARRQEAARLYQEAQRRKAEERAQRASAPRGDAAKELERVVEEGVALLLGAAAKKLRETSARLEEKPLPDTEFNRFVAKKKGGAARGPVVTPPPASAPRTPRVRVDAEDDHELEPEERGATRRRRA